MAGRKIFVGSLPDNVDVDTLQIEFSKYGVVEDVFVKPNCDSGRQWAFITFSAAEQAQLAKDACDRVLMLPGSARACDVMMAKNQGMFGQDPIHGAPSGVAPAAMQAPKKIFVGSLPDGMQEEPLRAEFSKYGLIEEIYMKQGCESGRQWAFVMFQTHEQASVAANSANGVLMFPGSVKTCEVTLARNQGMFGQGSMTGAPPKAQAQMMYQPAMVAMPAAAVPKKIFVGSLPDDIDEMTLRAEFSKYGEILEVFIKTGCEPGRQWAFITFASPEQAQYAKQSTDRVLLFAGAQRACEVTFARNQGLFGQESTQQAPQYATAVASYQPQPQPVAVDGPRKIFVGSLPDSITDASIRAEFSKYGHIVDCFLKTGCEPGRQWAFVTFAAPEQAQYAKDCCDRVLMFPGSAQACEVMLAKNQGKFGQASQSAGGYQQPAPAPAPMMAHVPAVAHVPPPGAVPPPPATPPPAHLTPWKMYKTVAGLPYYHNSTTGVTQWECPPELQGLPSTAATGVRYGPY